MSVFRFLSSILLAVILAACGGGGDPGPDQPQSAAVPQPTIERLTQTNVWPDIYAKFRLRFDSADVIGFAAIPGDEVVKPEDLEVWWDSGNMTGYHPDTPHGAIKRGSDGKLYADLPMFYSGDRGIYVLAKKGFVPYTDMNGQPVAYMLPDQWKLPPGMTVVEIPGLNGLRRWIDWKDPAV